MITIGIPSYNRLTYLPQVLRQCLSQTYDDYEIVLCDSSSHTEIKKLAESFQSPKIRYFHYPPETKITPKLNDMLRRARGDYMLILCDDDRLEKDYLRVMAKNIETHPDAALYRCRYRLIDSEGEELRLDRAGPARMSPAEFLRHVFMRETEFFKMNISGIIFPRKLLLELGGFLELPIPWHTERIAWSSLASRGGCIFEPQPLCSIRLHAGSITSSFNRDLISSIQSDIRSREAFEQLIEDVESRELSPEDRIAITEARHNLNTYMARHMSRSMDHGFLTFLSTNEKGTFSRIRHLFRKMQELSVPVFRSARLYYFLSALPYRLRLPVLNALKQYKVRKWCV